MSNLTFSQRNGYEEVPPQLKPGELSATFMPKLCRLIIKVFEKNWESYAYSSNGSYQEEFLDVMTEFYFDYVSTSLVNSPQSDKEHQWFNTFWNFLVKAPINKLFDVLELFISGKQEFGNFVQDLALLCEKERLAYRLVDKKFIQIGSQEEAESIIGALNQARISGANGARTHLVNAGVDLRNGDWAGSIHNSISAVECVAKEIAQKDNTTLNKALNIISKHIYIHPALKTAFDKLYSYASDENGIRHANGFGDDASNVDESDALFMLGACASFVTYLLSKYHQIQD